MNAFIIAIFFALFGVTASGCNGWSDSGLYVESAWSPAYDSTHSGEQAHGVEQLKPKKGHVYVTKVVDGDTFWIEDGSKPIKVRFIGIDAPETRNAGRKKKGYFGQEAKDYVTKLTLHKWVRLEWDAQKKDRYQRALAYVYLADGTFLNAMLVANGFAVVDTYPPNVKHVDLFTDLQRQAKRKKLGLWGNLSF